MENERTKAIPKNKQTKLYKAEKLYEKGEKNQLRPTKKSNII